MDDLPRPEGIEPEHIHEASGSILRRGPFGLGLLAVVLAPALFGVYGSDTRLTASGDGVLLEVDGPDRARNGEFFEVVVSVEARRNIENLVVMIGSNLWRDVTVNTLLPDPSEHGFRNGAYELRFGEISEGERLEVKIDAQINPAHSASANRDTIAVADGDSVLAKIFYEMRVLP
jgi:hypothetical protein